MEAAIEKNTNDELKKFQLKLSILEEELRQAIARAEMAEKELEKYKSQETTKTEPLTLPVLPLLPPPPPPPMPANLLYKAPTASNANIATTSATGMSSLQDSTFTDRIAQHNLHKSNNIGGGQKLIETVKQQVQPEAATGRCYVIFLHHSRKNTYIYVNSHTDTHAHIHTHRQQTQTLKNSAT